MHNLATREVFSNADAEALRCIGLYCRECDVAGCRDLMEYCTSDYARDVAATIIKISRKRSLRGVVPDVRRWARAFMREAGTYNEGR